MQASGLQCTPSLLHTGTLHNITIFSLVSLIISMVIAFAGIFLGKLRKDTDYEVSFPACPSSPWSWGHSFRPPSAGVVPPFHLWGV